MEDGIKGGIYERTQPSFELMPQQIHGEYELNAEGEPYGASHGTREILTRS